MSSVAKPSARTERLIGSGRVGAITMSPIVTTQKVPSGLRVASSGSASSMRSAWASAPSFMGRMLRA